MTETRTLRNPIFITALALFSLCLTLNGLTFYFNQTLEKFLTATHQPQLYFIFLGFIAICISVIFPVIMNLVSFYPLKKPSQNLTDYLGEHFESLMIESLRAWGLVLKRGLCFLIPGVVAYYRLIFVSAIAIFNVDYQKGTVDALKLSAQMTKSSWKPLGWSALFQTFIPLVSILALESFRQIESPYYPLFFVSAIDAFLFFIANYFLFRIMKETSL